MTAPTLIDQLRAASELVLETAEIEAVRQYDAQHVSLSASGITAAAQLPEHKSLVDQALSWAQLAVGKGGNRKLVAIRAVERLAIEFAREMVGVVPGHVSIEVDGRLAYKRRQLIDRTRAIAAQLTETGAQLDRFRFKIPATWEGVQAAAKLKSKDGIRCHMTLVFGTHQLAACADAGVDIIAPAVGRITDWHKKNDGVEGYPPSEDPGVVAAAAMGDYLTSHGYDSKLMPSMFRGVHQALALAGREMICLPPKLLSLLPSEGDGDQLLATAPPATTPADKVTVDAARFQALHAADPVSATKLQSSVKNLSWAVVSQEKQLADWISTEQGEAAELSTLALFGTWDHDGDGFIDREEWCGTEEVFNALDRDNNGRISLEEMAIGLGAPHKADD
jgi:transaldolase